MAENINISEALVLYLRHYPGKNDDEFISHYGPEVAAAAKEAVRALLEEAMKLQPDWNRLSLNEAGDYVESAMRDRHPELSTKALECIGNYYTYLMR
jgi:triphosphoribosyl-dephospho-CoA synthetase